MKKRRDCVVIPPLTRINNQRSLMIILADELDVFSTVVDVSRCVPTPDNDVNQLLAYDHYMGGRA